MIWDWLKDKRPFSVVLKSRMEGNVVVVCGRKLEMSYLNKTAGIVLGLCDGDKTICDIKNCLLQRFDVSEEELQNDLIEVIRDLQFKRLIQLEA